MLDPELRCKCLLHLNQNGMASIVCEIMSAQVRFRDERICWNTGGYDPDCDRFIRSCLEIVMSVSSGVQLLPKNVLSLARQEVSLGFQSLGGVSSIGIPEVEECLGPSGGPHCSWSFLAHGTLAWSPATFVRPVIRYTGIH